MKLVGILQSIANGGSEKQLLLLSRSLSEMGWTTEIWTLAPPQQDGRMQQLMDEAKSAGVVVRLPKLGRLLGWLEVLFRLIMSRSTMTIWTWGLRAEVLGQIAAVLNRSLHLILTLRWAEENRIRKEAKIRSYLRAPIRGFISNSERARLMVEEHEGQKYPVRIVPNIFLRSDLKSSLALPEALPDVVDLAVVGHFRTKQKGYDIFPNLIRYVRKQGVNIRIHLAGRNDDGGEFLDELSGDEFRNSFNYYGVVKEMGVFLSSAQLYLSVSRSEGMSNALIEAMLLGLPAVATRTGDVGLAFKDREIVHVAEIDDVGSIGGRIVEAVRNWSETRKMAARGTQFCLSYSDPAKNAKAAKGAIEELSALV